MPKSRANAVKKYRWHVVVKDASLLHALVTCASYYYSVNRTSIVGVHGEPPLRELSRAFVVCGHHGTVNFQYLRHLSDRGCES